MAETKGRAGKSMDVAFWRRWHRWIGWVAAVFMLFAATTGVIVAMTEFFGEEEALREATRGLVSPVSTADSSEAERELHAALLAAAREAPGAPVDQVLIRFKGPQPIVAVYLGKPGGGEDRRLEFDGRTGALLRTASYVDKPLINRIHSGEAFGDGGLVVAMLWGIVVIVMTISGTIIYLSMRRSGKAGLQRVFW